MRACFRCPECDDQVRAHDDLLLVAGMRVSQRATTHRRRASHTSPTGRTTRARSRTGRPARVTRSPRRRGCRSRRRVDGKPPYEVVDAATAQRAARPRQGRPVLRLRGRPAVDGRRSRLGPGVPVGRARAPTDDFRPLWAHDRPSERKALVEFLAHGAQAPQALPEHAHLPLRGLREDARCCVWPPATASARTRSTTCCATVCWSTSFRWCARAFGSAPRTTASSRSSRCTWAPNCAPATSPPPPTRSPSTPATASCATTGAGRGGDRAQGDRGLQPLRLPLDAQAARLAGRTGHRVRRSAPRPAPVRAQARRARPPGTDEIADDLDRTLLRFAGRRRRASRTAEQTAVALVAAARGFHRREDKPFWWAHFDRLNNPVDEWDDNSDVFIAEHAEIIADWHQPPRARKPQRHVRLERRHRATASSARRACSRSTSRRRRPASPTTSGPPRLRAPSSRAPDATTRCARHEVVIVEKQPKDGDAFDQLPFALTPGPPINTDSHQQRVDRARPQAAVRHGPAALPAHRGRRHPVCATHPRTRQRWRRCPAPASIADRHHRRAARPRLVLPGGARAARHRQDLHRGRGHRPARQRARLARRRRRTVACGRREPVLRRHRRPASTRRGSPRSNTVDQAPGPAIDQDGVRRLHRRRTHGCVVGGTAWDFANDNRVAAPSLDLLVIDEAGQFSLANTIAVARAARNLLLLGDPQQLPQVSQGTHPEPVDTSALGWLVDGHDVLPAELGYFLDRVLSHAPRGVRARCPRLSYDGQLHSRERRHRRPRTSKASTPGVARAERRPRRQLHRSPEEADAIVGAIGGLLGTRLDRRVAARGRCAQTDVLVVTPYNAQVVTAAAAARRRRARRRRGRHRRQVPGQTGAGRVRVDGGVVGRRRAARNLVPAQPQPAQRRDQPGQVLRP